MAPDNTKTMRSHGQTTVPHAGPSLRVYPVHVQHHHAVPPDRSIQGLLRLINDVLSKMAQGPGTSRRAHALATEHLTVFFNAAGDNGCNISDLRAELRDLVAYLADHHIGNTVPPGENVGSLKAKIDILERKNREQACQISNLEEARADHLAAGQRGRPEHRRCSPYILNTLSSGEPTTPESRGRSMSYDSPLSQQSCGQLKSDQHVKWAANCEVRELRHKLSCVQADLDEAQKSVGKGDRSKPYGDAAEWETDSSESESERHSRWTKNKALKSPPPRQAFHKKHAYSSASSRSERTSDLSQGSRRDGQRCHVSFASGQ